MTNLANSTQTFSVGNAFFVFQVRCQYNTTVSTTGGLIAAGPTFTLAPGETGQCVLFCGTSEVQAFCIDSSYLFIVSPFRFSSVVTANMTNVPIGLSFRVGINPGNASLIFTNDSNMVNSSTSNPQCPFIPSVMMRSKYFQGSSGMLIPEITDEIMSLQHRKNISLF